MKVGDRVQTTIEWDYFPDFTLPANSVGTIVEMCEDMVWVKMDKTIDGCEYWENKVSFCNRTDQYDWLPRAKEALIRRVA